jgi:membrane protease YdiL (CAAX protease family)
MFTLSSLLGLAACRSSEIFRHEPISKSNLFAILLGLGLLASRSAWNGFNPIAFNVTVSGTLLLITVCVLAPVCEELFFRGYLWSKLVKRGYAAVTIIITTSLLYVLPHVPSSFVAFADYATIGLFLATIRYLSGGIVLPVLFHIAMNSMLIFKL